MDDRRIRIIDIAEELGVSTATVSNVIHGKTKKISNETVKRVQQLLEERQYIPSMAGILLAQNDSKIIGVVVNDHKKYEGHTLEDQFISALVNALAKKIEYEGKFLMLKVTDKWDEIPKFASMWNMEGLVLIGFCKYDYSQLKAHIHIPIVVFDGYLKSSGNFVNIQVDDFDGGKQVGDYLKCKGHSKVLCLSDNDTCMDNARFRGLQSVIPDAELMIIPMEQGRRLQFYNEHLKEIKKYSAVFAVSDYYAMDFITFLKDVCVSVPDDISVVGFDNVRESEKFIPALTTIKQDYKQRALLAVEMLNKLKTGDCKREELLLPVTLVKRDSVCDVKMYKKLL